MEQKKQSRELGASLHFTRKFLLAQECRCSDSGPAQGRDLLLSYSLSGPWGSRQRDKGVLLLGPLPRDSWSEGARGAPLALQPAEAMEVSLNALLWVAS